MISTKTTNKGERFNLRATTRQRQLIALAAEKEHKSFSDFILDNAVAAAEALVRDDATFVLNQKDWDAFSAALDAPPRQIPALHKILTEQSVLDVE